MLSKRSQNQNTTVCFSLYDVQEQTKLIYDYKSQKRDDLWTEDDDYKGCEGSFQGTTFLYFDCGSNCTGTYICKLSYTCKIYAISSM